MAEPIITLTTDFGEGSPYVAAMKGVILSLDPSARLLDLSHRIKAQAIRHAAYFLASAIPHFPHEALHVVVVDPGVGTERALLYVEVGGHRLLAPDNGCWTALARRVGGSPQVIQLVQRSYWRSEVSATFHGRDILAPVAGHLSRGLNPRLLGPAVSTWVTYDFPAPTLGPDRLAGEVLFVDDFGNLLTNIPGEAIPLGGRPAQIFLAGHEIARRVSAYGEAPPGALVALLTSAGMLEIAVSHGSAADRLKAGVGAAVEVRVTE